MEWGSIYDENPKIIMLLFFGIIWIAFIEIIHDSDPTSNYLNSDLLYLQNVSH